HCACGARACRRRGRAELSQNHAVQGTPLCRWCHCRGFGDAWRAQSGWRIMTEQIFGITFSPLSGVEIADLVTADRRPDRCRLLVTANLDHIAQLSTNPGFRAAYDGAWLATIDGAPVYLYGRLRGIAASHRVPGA